MNWGVFALAVTAMLFIGWIIVATRRRWSPIGLFVSFALLLAAALNSAAPFRGVIDPEYMGYVFGLLRADSGLAVTALAGPILVGGAAAAFVALRRRSGPALWLVAGACLTLAIVLGQPWLSTVLTDPSENSIQFGEYLTIPGLVGSALLFVLLVLPFVVGVVWATIQAMRPSEAPRPAH